MRYLLLICWDAEHMNGQDEPAPGTPRDPDEPEDDWVVDLRERGVWQIGDQLAPPRRAKTVRVREGKRLVTDGPFAESKEAVGGFDLLECESIDEAIEAAAAHPLAGFGTIEVRPLWGN